MSRQGLKRLQCPALCGALVYATLSQLERHGMPSCACGAGAMIPEDLEVAAALNVDTPALEEARRRIDNKERAQLRSIGRQGEMLRRHAGTLGDMSAKAMQEIRAELREEARARRLSGLRQYQAAAAAAADMPF